MTHTLCGQPIEWRESPKGDLRLMVPYCHTCQRLVEDDTELSAGRPWELVDEDDCA
jgi:hypothetical protein